HDQELPAKICHHGHHDGSAASGDTASFCNSGKLPAVALVAAINEPEKFAAQARELVDGVRPIGPVRRIHRLLGGSYGRPQLIELATLTGWQIDGLKLKRDREQARAPFVGKFKGLVSLSSLEGSVSRLSEQRSGIRYECPPFGFRNTLTGEQEKRLAGTSVQRGGIRPLARLHQHEREKPRGSQMVERSLISGEYSKRLPEI